ncbi:lytic transglycosylase domain-containing protein [Glaciihabitans tibetensis]|nr:lytic transglycosylase domain-containing protein [Glaciihabitans tibetensis]
MSLIPVVGLLGAVVWIAQISSVRDDLGGSDFSTTPTTDVLTDNPISSPGTVTAPAGQPAGATGLAESVDGAWLDTVAASTSIPRRALAAYAGASLQLAQENPACNLGWTTLAGIGQIESGHASHGGASLQGDGSTDLPIRGPALDGVRFMAIADTDGGAWDGDSQWDRAVGPLQFVPGTWSTWGADGNGDGASDPNQIDDAVLAAGRYLCHSGDLSSVEGWRAGIFSYNHDDAYVDSVAAAANGYARLS